MEPYELRKQELQLTALWAWCRNNPKPSFADFRHAAKRALALSEREMDKQRGHGNRHPSNATSISGSTGEK